MGYVGYETPIAQSDYLSAGLISAVLGFFLMAYFFMYTYGLFSYQIAYRKNERKIRTEIGTAFFGSAFLSVGVIFLFLSVGIYLWLSKSVIYLHFLIKNLIELVNHILDGILSNKDGKATPRAYWTVLTA